MTHKTFKKIKNLCDIEGVHIEVKNPEELREGMEKIMNTELGKPAWDIICGKGLCTLDTYNEIKKEIYK